ncbi:hypothetical protein K2P47_00515 [Patescibacteria group bacterium]|nr:hypothetical protein [Patescibacteria group bacterium]
METASAVGDGKLDNDELGILFRRITEIARRIDAGSISKKSVLEALQAIVEGRAEKMLSPCNKPHRSVHVKFVPPADEERKKSLAPVAMRLPVYANKLGLYDRLREQYPSGHYPEKHPEDIMALMWEAKNIPDPMINYGRVPVQTILDEPDPSVHDRMVMASTLQWLGTTDGRDFLVHFVLAADLSV